MTASVSFDQLRIFIAVAEREHVTHAAEALDMSQSAVSAAVSALEERHGVTLFERVGRGIRLTETGRLFLPEARAVLTRAQAAWRVLEDVADLGRGSLHVAASQTLASYWLPAHVVAFHAAHPGIELTFTAGNSSDVVAAVEGLRADLGFIEGGDPVDTLVDRRIGDDELYLVVSSGHAWAQTAPGPAELAEATWVMRERGSGTRQHMDAALVELGVSEADPAHILELPTNEAVRQAVIEGGGATLLSRLVVGADLAAGRLARVHVAPVRRIFRLLRHPERHMSHAARAFLALVDGQA